jgi:hypothetical protein
VVSWARRKARNSPARRIVDAPSQRATPAAVLLIQLVLVATQAAHLHRLQAGAGRAQRPAVTVPGIDTATPATAVTDPLGHQHPGVASRTRRPAGPHHRNRRLLAAPSADVTTLKPSDHLADLSARHQGDAVRCGREGRGADLRVCSISEGPRGDSYAGRRGVAPGPPARLASPNQHDERPGTVTVAGNIGADMPHGTLTSIRRQAGLQEQP